MLQTSKLFVYFLQVYFYKWHITKNTVHVEQSLQEDMTASYNTSQILNFVSFFTPSKKNCTPDYHICCALQCSRKRAEQLKNVNSHVFFWNM